MAATPLRINFILGFIEKTGGGVVALEYAYRLGKLGHDVRVYYPLLPYALYASPSPKWKVWPSRIRKFVRNLRKSGQGIGWFRGRLDVHPVPVIARPFIRSADVTIATVSATAHDVAALPDRIGAKFYLVQGYEIWNGSVDRVHASYALPLKIIVIAPWLNELLKTKFRARIAAEIHNGVDLEFYHPLAKRSPGPPAILMMYHIQEVKGIPDGLEVLRRIHESFPNTVIRMFGMYPFPDKDGFIEYSRDPSLEELRALYQSSDVFLCPSRAEGWYMPNMEAMACGCVVVSTNVGCIQVLREEGKVMVAEPGDKDTLYRLIHSLIKDPSLLRGMAESGIRIISDHGWDGPVRQMEALLDSARNGAEAPAD